MYSILDDNKKRLNVKCSADASVNICFKELIINIYEKYKQKVVILIDEYDKPILDNLSQVNEALIIRDALLDFYTKIKDADRYIKFVMLTGVSKFSKISIFSGLNNLTDISLDERYGNICGYTQKDIESQFLPYLTGVDLAKLKVWYNGYNFLGDKVYNSFDILLFIQKNKIYRNYWFETGTPRFLLSLIKKQNYFLPNLENLKVDERLLNSFEIEEISLETIMFQAGYLTITNMEETFLGVRYHLGFPNREVQMSFNDYILQHFMQSSQKDTIRFELFNLLEKADLKHLEVLITRLFANIAYNNFTKNEIAHYEGFYASVLYAYFASLGLKIIAEDVTNQGRIDLSIQFEDKTYIFEFKVTKEAPLKQIKEMQYYQKYSGDIYIIGIVFDREKRNISQFEWEKLA